ncbi:MAG: hypothetical protein IV100_33390, partial [Myxococcales bacterium]|nr:hypothetical protein [Myxococcales bacterium]
MAATVRAWSGRLAASLIVLPGLAFAAPPERLDVDGASTLLANVEARVQQLEREASNPVAESTYYPIEKRLIDAQVYFDL